MKWEYKPLRYEIFKEENYKDVIYKGKNIFPVAKRIHIMNKFYNVMYTLDHVPTKTAVEEIVERWFQSKKNLILMMSSSPLYNGNFQIVEEIEQIKRIHDREVMLRMNDLMRFCHETESINLTRLPDIFYSVRGDYYDTPSFVIEKINDLVEGRKNKEGRTIKFSTNPGSKLVLPRLLNKLFCWNGSDKVPGYNKAFDSFSQAITPGKQKLRRVLSLNLLDYITMSCGNSWTSCHTIDTESKFIIDSGRSYHGAYCSGTLSYGLDKTSLVLYEIPLGKSLPEEECKIFRNMIHYHNGDFIQGRVYPQEEDASKDKYKDLNDWFKEKINETTFLSKRWTKKWGTRATKIHSRNYGTHYNDTSFFKNCNYNHNSVKTDQCYIEIGAIPICVHCGQEHNDSANLICEECNKELSYLDCMECGKRMEADEVVYDYNEYGDPIFYCRDCSYFCDLCQEVHVRMKKHKLYKKNGLKPYYVCDNITYEKDYYLCEHCHIYHKNDKDHIIIEVDGVKHHFCGSSCAIDEGYYYVKNKWRAPTECFICSKCGEIFLLDDMSEENRVCKKCFKE